MAGFLGKCLLRRNLITTEWNFTRLLTPPRFMFSILNLMLVRSQLAHISWVMLQQTSWRSWLHQFQAFWPLTTDKPAVSFSKNQKISVVGTRRKNKKELPPCFTENRRPEFSNQVGQTDLHWCCMYKFCNNSMIRFWAIFIEWPSLIKKASNFFWNDF